MHPNFVCIIQPAGKETPFHSMSKDCLIPSKVALTYSSIGTTVLTQSSVNSITENDNEAFFF